VDRVGLANAERIAAFSASPAIGGSVSTEEFAF
jgi:hypothetical protein